MKILLTFIMLLPLFAFADGHDPSKEHGGKAAEAKEHGGEAAEAKEHGGEAAEAKEHGGKAASLK
jgi:hypothetical protein